MQGDNTHGYVRPINANSNLYLGGNNTNHVAISGSNGFVGLGTLSPQAELHIVGQNVGTTIGNKSNSLILQNTNGNVSLLEINDFRTAAGNSWNTAGYRIQQKTDNTWQSYIQFNGGTDFGISVGTGGSNTNAQSVVERIRITQDGTIDVKNNPIVNCTNVASAWVRYTCITLATPTAQPNTNTLVPYINQNRVDWRSPANTWWDLYLGMVFYINVFNTLAPLGGVSAVSRPNGFQGVRIRIVEIIQNSPTSIVRCEFLDGIASNNTIITGTGTTAGFTSIASPIYESYNVSSITRHGVGENSINFITAMPNRNYAVIGVGGMATDTWQTCVCPDMTNNATAATPNVAYYSRSTTQSARFTLRRTGANSIADPYNVNIAVFAASGQDNV
jgi:hypothetical protein